jgi:hypothetical protein
VRQIGFGLVLLTAVVVVACGRQVTPNPVGLGPGGAPEGFTSVFFDVPQPFNFSSYQYWIIFDTTGDGQTPSTQPYDNNYAGYSEGIEVAGSGGSTFAQPVQFIKEGSHIPPHFQVLPFTPQNFIYNANSNGSGTEFNVIFRRSIFLGIPHPSPSPLAHNWTYNAFTTQATTLSQLVFVDSMGAGGKLPPQYSSPILPTWQCFDTNAIYALSSGLQIDPPAQIVSVEIANNPSPTPSVKPSAVPCSSSTDDARSAITR